MARLVMTPMTAPSLRRMVAALLLAALGSKPAPGLLPALGSKPAPGLLPALGSQPGRSPMRLPMPHPMALPTFFWSARSPTPLRMSKPIRRHWRRCFDAAALAPQPLQTALLTLLPTPPLRKRCRLRRIRCRPRWSPVVRRVFPFDGRFHPTTAMASMLGSKPMRLSPVASLLGSKPAAMRTGTVLPRDSCFGSWHMPRPIPWTEAAVVPAAVVAAAAAAAAPVAAAAAAAAAVRAEAIQP